MAAAECKIVLRPRSDSAKERELFEHWRHQAETALMKASPRPTGDLRSAPTLSRSEENGADLSWCLRTGRRRNPSRPRAKCAAHCGQTATARSDRAEVVPIEEAKGLMQR
jgi:hypothetical protein